MLAVVEIRRVARVDLGRDVAFGTGEHGIGPFPDPAVVTVQLAPSVVRVRIGGTVFSGSP